MNKVIENRLIYYKNLKKKLSKNENIIKLKKLGIKKQILIKKNLNKLLAGIKKTIFFIHEGLIIEPPRKYKHGDPLKNMNISKTMAKLDMFHLKYNFFNRVYINVFNEERNLQIFVLFNVSASMFKDEGIFLTNDIFGTHIVYSIFIQSLFFILANYYSYSLNMLPFGHSTNEYQQLYVKKNVTNSFISDLIQYNLGQDNMMMNGELEIPLMYLQKKRRIENNAVVIINSFEDTLNLTEKHYRYMSLLRNRNDVIYLYIVPEHYGLEKNAGSFYYKDKLWNTGNNKEYEDLLKEMKDHEEEMIENFRNLNISCIRVRQNTDHWLPDLLNLFVRKRLKG